MEKISVYIPCFNSGQYLAAAIQAVLEQTYPVDEILIIDDGSTDGAVQVAGRFPVRIISHGSNRGLAAARNTAFKEARNELVAALDADCVAGPDWLSQLMLYVSTGEAAGVGGKLVEKFTSTLADQWRAAHMAQHWGDIALENPRFLFGCNTLMRKSLVVQAGGYLEILRTNYEDVDLSQRLMKAGARLIYTPYAVVTHLRRDTVVSVLQAFEHWYHYQYFSYDSRISSLARLALLIKTAAKISLGRIKIDLQIKRYHFLVVDVLLFIYLLINSRRRTVKLQEPK